MVLYINTATTWTRTSSFPPGTPTTSVPSELAAHCMEDIDKGFIARVKPGDIMVADKTLAAALPGSTPPSPSRRRASPWSSPRPCPDFYRNSINIGLPIMECEEPPDIKAGDEVDVDFDTGVITNVTTGKNLSGPAVPAFYSEYHRKRRPAEQHSIQIIKALFKKRKEACHKKARNYLFRAFLFWAFQCLIQITARNGGLTDPGLLQVLFVLLIGAGVIIIAAGIVAEIKIGRVRRIQGRLYGGKPRIADRASGEGRALIGIV